ncbi:adenylate/guanylate cyclase domain-containing response regulator [Mesorhizobium sp. M7A.T.Ca.TU.009.01.3.2]|nr:adenylate/guanylate cyclase domain-containing response regulator [Mesorhizobium sp. M7A.T.Ca.TU.009.01.3.2]RUV14855.1 adenylate/guanylate cyclase domain-containing response regulator [Mesorhizobium sp. M7A.T.Ca.TU.009.01.3.1]
MTARILVVDDEPDLEVLIVQKFRRQIRDGAVIFLFASDGVDALSVIDGNSDIDMVLCDINMPRMDGLSLLEKLQQAEGQQLSTVIVSAYGDMANIRTAMNRGAFDFITKPIDFADLETTIAKTLKHREVLHEAHRRQAVAERAHASLSRYFSPNLAERLAGDADGLALAGQWREVASLFTDVTSFTTLVETIDPATLGALLNDYLAGMTDVVFAHEGTVAKIVGDALHVLFGAPGEQQDHAARAVACALELDALSQSFRDSWRDKGVTVGTTRIGVHAGPALVGNFGGGRFFDYTAYGDTINIAARLESANKQLGTRICVSGSAAVRVDGFRGRPVGDLMLRGRAEALRAFEPLSSKQYDDPSTASYLEAFGRLEAGDANALMAFAAQIGKCPDDQLASFHLKRLLNGAKGTQISLD